MRRLWITAAIPAMIALGCSGGGGSSNNGGLSTAGSTTNGNTSPTTSGSTGGITSGTTGGVTSGSGTVTTVPGGITVTPPGTKPGTGGAVGGSTGSGGTVVVGGGTGGSVGGLPGGGTSGGLPGGGTSGGGTSGGSTATQPMVSSVTPSQAASGDAVTLVGTNLDKVTDVSIGGTKLTGTVIQPTEIKGTLGNHAAGAADVVVTDKTGASFTFKNLFTYTVPAAKTPVITKATPSSAAPGDAVALTGTDLDQAVNVYVGGVPATVVKATSTEIDITLGQHAAGAVNITCKDTTGKIDTFTGLFTYTTTSTGGSGTGTVTSSTTPSTLSVQAMGNMAVARGLHTATLLDDGRVLIVGGVDATKGTFVAENEVFDPTANAFTKTSDPSLGGNPGGYMAVVATISGKQAAIPAVRYQHTATKMADGRVLIVGGVGIESVDAQGKPVVSDLTSAFIFDPKTNSFSGAGQLQTGRSAHRAVLLGNGMVMVMGGFNATLNNGQGGSVQSVEIFDPAQNAWGTLKGSTGKDLVIPRQDAAAVNYGGTAVIAGGLAVIANQQGQVQPYLAPSMEMFDPQQGKFVGVQNGPTNDRYGANMEVLDTSKDLVLVGGIGGNAQATTMGPVLDVERMDSQTGTWSTVAKLASGRAYASTVANGDQILIAGGVDVDAQGNLVTATDAVLFDGTNNSVATVKLASARTSCTVTAIKGGWLVLGGFSGAQQDMLGLDGQTVGSAELVVNGAATGSGSGSGTGSTGSTGSTGTLTITDVSPKKAAPGQTITITGTNLDQMVDVQVGGVNLTVTSQSATEIKGKLGTHKDGMVNVTIKDKAGSIHSMKSAFTYDSTATGGSTGGTTTQMSITAVSPASGPAGTAVTITGQNFANLTDITVGGVSATTATPGPKYNSTTITFTVPTGVKAGAQDIVVTSSSAGTVTKTGGFTVTTSSTGGSTGGTTTALTYTNDIQPILQARCYACHQNSSGQGKLSLGTYSAVKSNIKVGNANSSDLYRVINGSTKGTTKDMVAESALSGSGPITAAEIQKIADWINSGAAQ